MYSLPNGSISNFFENLLSANDKTSKNIFAADLNINVLYYESNKKVKHFLSSMFQYNMPTINKSTCITRNTAKAMDHIIVNTVISGIQHSSGIIKLTFQIIFQSPLCLHVKKVTQKIKTIYL